MHARPLRARLAPLGALLAFLAAAGCESLAEREKYLTSASVFEWTNERFKVAGQDEMWGQVGVHDGTITFFAKGFPPGTRFTLGTATATVGEDGNAKLEAPAQGLYGSLPFGTVEMPTIDGATMNVEAPGRAALEVPLPPVRVPFPGSLLLEVAKGPVLFAGDDPGDAKLDNIVFDATAQSPLVVGTAPKTLGDVDAVAIMTLEPTGQAKECTGYMDEQGKAMGPVQLKLAHTTVAVHIRRTGEKLATKQFAPVEDCPASFMKWSDEDVTSLRPYIPVGEIEPWLESILAGRP